MESRPHITRYASQGVTLLGDQRRPGGVTLAFTERTGGYSLMPYASLNLGDACGDREETVAANRRMLLQALDCGQLGERLVNPRQVHGSEVLVISDASDAAVAQARHDAREGVDAIVCSAREVPVLLCFADCVPVVLVAPGAFAVIHSGWRGTYARISQKALRALVQLTGVAASEVLAYVGPHIGGADYEVSRGLAEQFAEAFGEGAAPDATHVDLGFAVRKTLMEAGVREEAIWDECPSTASCTKRFYSYRAEGGTCGRYGAIAVLLDQDEREV